ncbi:hypothetical protein PINS_up016938 [Pythium insidiosum]|nr:hypothetical protein PINS_up016938 [Pythium insidiosum]
MHLYQLHLTGNPISTLDRAILELPGLDYLSLGYTKLTKLPEKIDTTPLQVD